MFVIKRWFHVGPPAFLCVCLLFDCDETAGRGHTVPYEGGRWKNPFDLNKKTETHKIGFLFFGWAGGIHSVPPHLKTVRRTVFPAVAVGSSESL